MSTDRDTTRIVRSWLEDGVTTLPDRVLDAVLDELPATPQRRATWWPARRSPLMNNALRVAVAAAAVLVVAFIGIQLFGGGNVGGPGPSQSESPPSLTPIARLDGQQPLDPGRYIAAIRPEFDVTVEVPSGWSAGGDWVAIGPRGNDVPDGMAIRFYTVSNVAANPRSHRDGPIDPPLGPTVDDLVEALVSHPDWETTAPMDITIDGYDGQLVALTIPADAENGESYWLSVDAVGGGIYGWAPEQTFVWYIVDVDGQRYIIDAFHYPGTSEEDLAAQRAVVESVQFDLKP